MKANRFFFHILFMALAIRGYSQPGKEKISVPLRFDHYYTYEQVVAAVKALNQAYPALTTIELVGKSDENREIWALTINNPKTGDPQDKPGVYLDGNIHGNEIQASEVCLYFADYLLRKFGINDQITKIVDRNVYYIIPSVNVDGRYHFFNDPNTSNSNRGLRIPRDDDKDGLFDEDYPDDLNGDGNIGMMRKADPFGNLKTDPEDKRLMVEIKPGEKGEWTLLGQEGIDNDGDGRINEDSEGYIDANRHWGFNWAPDYVQRGAGNYPLEGAGIRAITDFIMKRPNIIIAYTFHNSGGMFLRGPGTREQGDFPRGDIQVFDYLGKNNENIVPGYRYLISWKDLYETYGDFGGFLDNIVGAYTFVGELHMSTAETYQPPSGKVIPEEDESGPRQNPQRSRERLKFNDHVAHGELYSDWQPFKHPVYGDIEVGGWVKMSSRLPHPFMLPDMVHRNASAVIFSSEQTPEVRMEVTETLKTGKDMYRVRIRLSNSKAMPSITYHAVRNKIHRQDILRLTGKNIKVISGGQLTDPHNNRVNYKEYKPGVQFLQVPGFGKVEYQFLVSGSGKLEISYESIKAGKLKTSVVLR